MEVNYRKDIHADFGRKEINAVRKPSSQSAPHVGLHLGKLLGSLCNPLKKLFDAVEEARAQARATASYQLAAAAMSSRAAGRTKRLRLIYCRGDLRSRLGLFPRSTHCRDPNGFPPGVCR